MLESADLLALVRHALLNSADGLQLLIFWQTVQGDSQSALVIGKSCSKAPRHSIWSKSSSKLIKILFAPCYFRLLFVPMMSSIPSDIASVSYCGFCVEL